MRQKHLGVLGITVNAEKEVLYIVALADDVFHFLYYSAGLDTPHAGMIMMGHAFRGAGVVPMAEPEAEAGAG